MHALGAADKVDQYLPMWMQSLLRQCEGEAACGLEVADLPLLSGKVHHMWRVVLKTPEPNAKCLVE